MTKKVLGLDLGTNSIGWAIIDKENQKILDSGVRIFQEGVKKDTIGKGDKEESKNSDRRQHRQARRLNYRKRLRKAHLLKLLIDFEMVPLSIDELSKWRYWNKNEKSSGKVFPNSEAFVNWLKINPYLLRKKGLYEDLTLQEFGRILYHFIQRRGFLSSRKGKAKDTGVIYKGKENMDGVDDTRQLLQNRTLGEALYEVHPKEGEAFFIRKDEKGKEVRVRARYTLREMYVEEFEKLWERQADQLGISDKQVPVKKRVYLKGSPQQKRNQAKLSHLIKIYGKENVVLNGESIEVSSNKPFKELLAGEIVQTEDGIRFKSSESVLFWQRPLRSQKSMLGKCSFENQKIFDQQLKKWIITGKSPAYVSHPDFELYRTHQFINNIKFGKSNQLLADEQRWIALDLINSKDKAFDFKQIKKALKLPHELFNYEDDFKVAGNKTHASVSVHFSKEDWKKYKEEIWHDLVFYEDSDLLAAKLNSAYKLDNKAVDKLSKIELEEGYASVSLKAIRNILPFLEMGYRYSTAVVLGGVKNAFGERWERFNIAHNEIIRDIVHITELEKHKEYELIEQVKAYLSDPDNKYGFVLDDKAFKKLYHPSQAIEKKALKTRLSEIENLRNPIVQKALYEMRRLINTLLDRYEKQYGEGFRFDRIQVEFGRDLKNSKQRRQEMVFRNRENEAKNVAARERLAEFGLRPSRNNITKYLLFQEIERKNGVVQCPYTGRTIKISDVLGNDNRYQIEHIIPFSVSLDDSFGNKTLCESNFNREKGELTPYEFYQQNSSRELWAAGSWEEIEHRAYKLLPYPKAKRFTMMKKPGADDFIQRQLNDTRYISKKAAEMLSEISDDVRVLPGQLTAELRRLWGLNHLLRDPLMTIKNLPVSADGDLEHYVIFDSSGKVKELMPVQNKRPESAYPVICMPGNIDNKTLFAEEKHYKQLRFEIADTNLKEGKYWSKLKLSEPLNFTMIYAQRPPLNDKYISLRGQVSKSKFAHDTIKQKITAAVEDGTYWISLPVKNYRLVAASRDQKPEPGQKEILLFGKVQAGVFSSYIFETPTDLPDGRYWLILEPDINTPEFLKARNIPETKADNELLLEGVVDDLGKFTADYDPDFSFKTEKEPGKYFVRFEVIDVLGFYPQNNEPPQLEKNETLAQAITWVDKSTGEIKIDIQKNREDQRHHALDAIVVAMSELSYLNQLSRYAGQLKEWERGKEGRPVFDLPWSSFPDGVLQAIQQILVSYAQNRKVVSKISKMVSKGGKSYKSSGLAARGRLHREFYFGQHPRPIVHQKNPQTGELLFEMDKFGNKQYYYHIRKSVTTIQNNKHVEKIVDEGIKQLIIKRLEQDYLIDTKKAYNIPSDFFYDKDKRPSLFLPNKNGNPVPVKKVRMRESIGNAEQLKDHVNQWVNPYNNHHVVIYEDHDGNLQEQVVSLWEVVERINQGQPMVQLPHDGKRIVETLQENEMFLIGLPEDILNNIGDQSYSFAALSSYLYRVQKISSMYYTFRHHLVSSVSTEQGELRIQSFLKWSELNPIKVKIDQTGKLILKL